MLLGTAFMLVIPEGVKACVQHNGNVGLNLLTGFIVVYLLDKCVHALMNSSSNFAKILNDNSVEVNSVKDLLRHPKSALVSILKNNVVFALFIHGISDGIALGTTSNNESLLFIVLIAIVIHKIPAVMSLTSLMISKQRLPEWEVLSNLFAFSLSTPLGYVVVSAFNMNHSDTMDWVGGSLLLMSGGSLLYASFSTFVGGDGHDHHMPLSDERHETDEYPLDVIDNNKNVHASPSEASFSMTQDTDANSSETQSLPQEILGGLPYDDSVYVLAGVIIPVIVSFVISED